MANKKISQLPLIDNNSLDPDLDVIAIVDASGVETKKISITDILEGNVNVSDKHYTHVQSVPSTTWTVNHNLSKNPSISIVDSSGAMMIASVTYIDEDNFIVNFNSDHSGVVECN